MNNSSHLPLASLPHRAIALQSRAAPQAAYLLPLLRALAVASAKSKRPLLLRTGPLGAARLSTEAGEHDEEPHLNPPRRGGFLMQIHLKSVQKRAKARCCARASEGIVGGQVIATARPFCFFCGYDKRSSRRGK